MDGPNASDTISKILPSDLGLGPVAAIAYYETSNDTSPHLADRAWLSQGTLEKDSYLQINMTCEKSMLFSLDALGST